MKRYSMDGTYTAVPGTRMKQIFLPVVDSMEKNTMWGRLHLRIRLVGSGLCHVYVLSDNKKDEIGHLLGSEETPDEKKAEFFYAYGRKAGTNCENMLLYEMRGRFLWIYIELTCSEKAVVDDIFIENPGDEFLQMFPEVYREPGGFFQRYLSVMSTLYRDMQKSIDEGAGLLDEREADRRLIRLYMRWLGFDGARHGLTEQEERALLRDLYWLNRRKGTKAAVLKLCHIFTGGEPVLMFMNGRELFLAFEERPGAFGEILSKARKLSDILKRFLPAGTGVRIVCGKEPAGCDGHTCLDINGSIETMPEGALDKGMQCGRCICV